MDHNAKFRHELKYLCSWAELEMLRVRLSAVMARDRHVLDTGKYHIRSIYFDDLYDTCFHDNAAGVNLREKWRIRIYNNSDRKITLESKKKENGMIQKRSCPLTMQQFEALVSASPMEAGTAQPALLNRFLFLQHEYALKPKVIVGYDRTPFVCPMGNVRVTLDTHIYSSTDIQGFFQEELRRRPILPTHMHLLEVKYDEFIPDHIFRTIQMTNMQLSTFSKYYLCRKYTV